MRDISQEEILPEGLKRSSPDETFAVYVIAEDGYHIPARLSSQEGFLVDLHNGKLEIRTGDRITIQKADSSVQSPTWFMDLLVEQKQSFDLENEDTDEQSKELAPRRPRRTFDYTEDIVRKRD